MRREQAQEILRREVEVRKQILKHQCSSAFRRETKRDIAALELAIEALEPPIPGLGELLGMET